MRTRGIEEKMKEYPGFLEGPKTAVVDNIFTVGRGGKVTMNVKVLLPSGREQVLHALIDTGAQVNLVRKGVIDKGEFCRARERLFLVTANGQPMEGGESLVDLDVVLNRETEFGWMKCWCPPKVLRRTSMMWQFWVAPG